ncbi:MAG: ATP-binding domain-containing protein [Rhodomicrobium sp.]
MAIEAPQHRPLTANERLKRRDLWHEPLPRKTIELQAALNPPGENKIEKFGWTFCPNDKVMQIENDYEKEVYNGDIGFVTKADAEAGEVCVSFEGREMIYGSGELDSLVLAYATTIHKSQGSEYPAVVLPLTTQHYPMLQRNLLYTGLTRGKKLVVIVGQRKAIAIAVRNASGRRCWTKLGDWLTSSPAAALLGS